MPSTNIFGLVEIYFSQKRIIINKQLRPKQMKKLLLCLLVMITSVTLMNAQKTEFSKKALNAKLENTDGKKIKFQNILKEHKGKTTVVEVWASWCGDCVKAMPKMKELQANNPDVDYVFVSMDKTPEKWKAGIEKHQIKGDHYLGLDGMKGVWGTAIDLDWIPRYIVIDKKGKIILYRAIETDFEQINDLLKSQK